MGFFAREDRCLGHLSSPMTKHGIGLVFAMKSTVFINFSFLLSTSTCDLSSLQSPPSTSSLTQPSKAMPTTPAGFNKKFDTIASAEQIVSLAEACTGAAMIHFQGTPLGLTAQATLHEMADFIASSCSRRVPMPLIFFQVRLASQACELQR